MRISTILVSVALFTAACRGSSNNNGTDGNTTDGTGSGGGTTIQDVQSPNMPAGTPVSLSGVVVTTIDAYGTKTGDMWVEEPDGGQYSGVHVYNAPVATVASLQPGDIVNITGAEKSEFALASDTSGRTLTELEPVSGGMMVVTKTGTGALPPIAQVDALMIGQLPDANNNGQRSAAWGAWEGVLINVTNVSALNTPKCVGSACNDATDIEFDITGDAVVESELAALPTIKSRDCLASVTGVVDYFFDYIILPRSTADVGTGGTGCPAAETSCADGVDNDGNGFTDCADNGCIVSASTCRVTTTINAIDTAATLPTGGQEIGATAPTEVYISAISSSGYNFWVSTNVAATANEGLYAFNSPTMLTAADVGKKVDLIGSLDAFNNDTMGNALTEFEPLALTEDPAAAVVPTASTQTAAALTVQATGQPWVGSLVTLTNVKVTTIADPNNHNIAELTQGATNFYTVADIHALTSPATTCFASITGEWTYDVYNNRYALDPIAEGTTGGTCP